MKGSHGGEDSRAKRRLEDWGGKAGSWQSRQFHIRIQINQEEKLKSKTDCATQGSSMRK